MNISTLLFYVALCFQHASATTYAQFCNDDNCSEGCGMSVSTDNPGCLTQYGRRSVKFHDLNVQEVYLISSPSNHCDCQNNCLGKVVGSMCNGDPQTSGSGGVSVPDVGGGRGSAAGAAIGQLVCDLVNKGTGCMRLDPTNVTSYRFQNNDCSGGNNC